MIDYNTYIQKYTTSSLEEKQKKLIELLEEFISYRTEIADVIEYVKQGKVSEKDMIDTYRSLVQSIQEVKQDTLHVSLDALVMLQKKLRDSEELEILDKQKEGDPDELLKNI